MVTTKITTLHSIKCRISSNTFKNIHIQSLGTAVSQSLQAPSNRKGPNWPRALCRQQDLSTLLRRGIVLPGARSSPPLCGTEFSSYFHRSSEPLSPQNLILLKSFWHTSHIFVQKITDIKKNFLNKNWETTGMNRNNKTFIDFKPFLHLSIKLSIRLSLTTNVTENC